jgi:hypothetical protein
MSIDPNSIPEHVLLAAADAYMQATEESVLSTDMAQAIAAALDALMDHEPVEVSRRVGWCGMSWQLVGWVYPDNVLAAVLARKTSA